MTNTRKLNRFAIAFLAMALAVVFFLSSALLGTNVVKAEKGPADGQHTAEITFVSKDKTDLKFMYLSGLLLDSSIKGASYDKGSNTLTLNNAELSKDNTHYSLTIANMGEDFKLNIVGKNSLDYLSLESIGYDTGCTITGYGTLDVGYLDISTDGKKNTVVIDNTVYFNADSKKMGYESLPAVKVSSKTPLTEMEGIISILGSTTDQLVYEENPSYTSLSYETTTNQLHVKPTHVVKKGSDGKWGYYVNDKLDTSFNGVAGNAFGLWKIVYGMVDFEHVGLTKCDDGWYYFNGGKADLGFNGLASNQYGSWFVQDGKVQFNYVGPVVLNGQKYTIDKGKVS